MYCSVQETTHNICLFLIIFGLFFVFLVTMPYFWKETLLLFFKCSLVLLLLQAVLQLMSPKQESSHQHSIDEEGCGDDLSL